MAKPKMERRRRFQAQQRPSLAQSCRRISKPYPPRAAATQAICTMTFSAATGATLISQVTCFIYSSVASIYSVVLAYGSNDITLVPNLTFSTNGMATYMVNQPTLLFLSSGQTPEVAVYNDGGSVSYLSCSIFGYRMSELPAPAETKPPSGQPLPGAALLPPPIR